MQSDYYRTELQQETVQVVHPYHKITLQMGGKTGSNRNPLQQERIISRIESSTDLGIPLVINSKKNEDLTICLDPIDLNKYV